MSQLDHFNNRDYNYSQTQFYNYGHSESNIAMAAERMEKDTAVQQRRERTAKIFKSIIAVLLFVIFCQVVYHLYFARNVTINRVEIESVSGFSASDEQIAEMAGIKKSLSYFSLDCAEVERRLERVPQIKNAQVEKKFPDTLKIKITGRTPLALCLVENPAGVIPVVIDSEGVIFQVGENVKNHNLPVMSGIKIDEAMIGAKMPPAVAVFLKSLEGLRAVSPVFFNSLSEFRVIRKANDDFEVLMYPENYSIPVRVGNKINKETFSYIMLVLDVAEQQGMIPALQELDFRTNEVVYKVRGE